MTSETLKSSYFIAFLPQTEPLVVTLILLGLEEITQCNFKHLVKNST